MTKTERTKPMLAHDYKQQGHRITFPCYGQPKLDGYRMMFNSAIGFWSRLGNNLPTANRLSFDTKGYTLDGEFKLPAGHTFQETVRAIRTPSPATATLVYHVFDVVMDGPWTVRMAKLEELSKSFPPGVEMVPSVVLKSREDVEHAIDFLVEAGYEGLILRNAKGLYRPTRSADLQKYKKFEDAEFTCVDIEGGEKHPECGILVLHTEDGRPFRAVPMGGFEARAEMLATRSPVGKVWTVKFKGRSEAGIPRHPTAIAERPAWDMKAVA